MTRSLSATDRPAGWYPTGRPVRRSGLWWYAPATTLALLAAAVAGVVALDPEHRHVPLCPFHAATGLQCPFCGSLRAVYNLVHGRLGAAVHDNVLFVLCVPVVSYLWLDTQRRRRRGLAARRSRPVVTVAVIGVLVAFTVVRNLPLGSWLRPA